MKSRYIINIILLLLIIGLYYVNNQSTTPAINTTNLLTSIASNDINHITISRPNNANIVLQKIAANWRLTQPLQAPANATRINLLLSLLNTKSYGQIPAEQQQLVQFGLSTSNITLKLNDQLFQFGDVEAISNHRYILYRNIIHLINDQITPLLNANASSFIENRLFDQQQLIEKISLPLRNTDQSLTDNTLIISNNNGHWQSDMTSLTSDQLTEIIDFWQHSYALQVSPLNTLNQQQDNAHTVKVWFKDQSPSREFKLQLSDRSLYISDQQQQLLYQFPATMLQQLLPLNTVSP